MMLTDRNSIPFSFLMATAFREQLPNSPFRIPCARSGQYSRLPVETYRSNRSVS